MFIQLEKLIVNLHCYLKQGQPTIRLLYQCGTRRQPYALTFDAMSI